MANLSNINGKFVVEQTTGYVGVGTTDPNFLIEAAGANSEIALNSTSASIYRLRSTSSDSFIITKNGVGDRLVIDGSGNSTFSGNISLSANKYILIGTDSGDAFNSDSAIRIQETGNAYVQIKTGTGNQGGVLIGDNDDDYVGGFIYSNSSNTLTFQQNNAAALTINGSGNATFAGNITFGDSHFIGDDADDNLLIQSSANENIIINSVDDLFLRTGGTTKLIVKNGGNVGIGTNSPLSPLTVHGQQRWYTTNNDGNELRGFFNPGGSGDPAELSLYQANGTSVGVELRATGNSYFNGGNVGIGSTNPQAKLQIDGPGLGEFAGPNSSNAGASHITLSDVGSGNRDLMSGPSIVFKTPVSADGTSLWATSRLLGSPSAAGSARGTFSIQVRDNYDPFNDGTSWNWRTCLTAQNNGNIGIGRNDPFYTLDIRSTNQYALRLNTPDANGCFLNIQTNGTTIGYLGTSYHLVSGTQSVNDLTLRANNNLQFTTGGGTERMRITSGGQLLVGVQSSQGASSRVSAKPLTTSGVCYETKTDSDGYYPMFFHNAAGVQKGYIFTNATSTSYNTSSDYRLKENVVGITGALDRVNQLRPSRFNFIGDADKTVDGFLAHEVQEIVPEAISGEKDAVDEKGNPDYQGIDQSKLVPLLVAAIQELKADNDSLKARIETLENN